MTTGTPSNVKLGPGWLYVAPLGTAEPATASASLDAAWRQVGYTENGTLLGMQTTAEDINVAEEFWPVQVAITAMSARAEFEMAEMTRENLALAMNVGAAEANDGTVLDALTDPADVLRVMLLWQANATDGPVWIGRRCLQVADSQIPFRKSPNKSLIPVQFRFEKPDGAAPWRYIPAADGSLAA